MIPASKPYTARYSHETGGKRHFSFKAVVAWSDDGVALVADHKAGHLVEANNYGNFAGLYEDAPNPVVAALPGGGWVAEHLEEDGVTTFTVPVSIWNVLADGTCEPQCIGSDGFTSDPMSNDNFVRLLGPEDVEKERLDQALKALTNDTTNKEN